MAAAQHSAYMLEAYRQLVSAPLHALGVVCHQDAREGGEGHGRVEKGLQHALAVCVSVLSAMLYCSMSHTALR